MELLGELVTDVLLVVHVQWPQLGVVVVVTNGLLLVDEGGTMELLLALTVLVTVTVTVGAGAQEVCTGAQLCQPLTMVVT